MAKCGFLTSDFNLCGRRFLQNRAAEFNESRHSNYLEGVDDAHCSIFKIGPSGERLNFGNNMDFLLET